MEKNIKKQISYSHIIFSYYYQEERSDKMLHFNEEDVTDLHNMDIELVLNHYGIEQYNNKKYLCPFHDDHEPSMILNHKKNRCECYVCHKKWDTIEFVRDKEDCTFTEALIKLIKISGGELSKYISDDISSSSEVRRLRKEEKQLLQIDSDLHSVYPKKPVKAWNMTRTEKGECFPNYNNDSDMNYYDGYLILEKPKFTENYLYEKFPNVYKKYVHEKLAIAIERVKKKYEGGNDTSNEIIMLNNLIKDYQYDKKSSR